MTGDNQDKSQGKITTGEQFTQTYAVKEDIATEPSLLISQEVFPLTEADFLRLKHRWSQVNWWADRLLFLGIGLLIVLAAKYVAANIFHNPVQIEKGEWTAPALAIVLALVLFLVGIVLPDERKKVMKDIEAHFTTAPRTRHIEERHQ